MTTRKQLIDTIEGYDAEIEALQQSKRETYDEHRANLLGTMGKDQVRDEIDALKKAIQRRRQIAKHGIQVVNDKDALVEEILAEVEARVARGARAREIIEEFPSADPTHVAADPAATVAENVRVAADHFADAGNMVLAPTQEGSEPIEAHNLDRAGSTPAPATNTPEASGTAREAPGGSAPSDGIADLSQPVEDQLRDGGPVAGSADLRAAQDGAQHAPHTHLQHDAGDRADTDPHSLVGSSNSNLQDDLGDQAGAAAAGLSNSCDMRRDSLKPVGLSIGAADIPHEGQIH